MTHMLYYNVGEGELGERVVGVFFRFAIKLLTLIYSFFAAWILSLAGPHPYDAKLWHARVQALTSFKR